MNGVTDSFQCVDRLLEETYGLPGRSPLPFGNEPDPLDELIYITLSQRTHRAGARRAFDALKARHPSWDDAATASETEISALIEPSGLAFLKAPRISRMLRKLRETHGSCSLGFLQSLPDNEAYSYLTQVLHAGYKTAWCVLLYSLGRDVFPADAHALRVLRRLGLLPEGPRHETLNRHIHRYVPPGRRYELHVNLIVHGRAVCRAAPLCGQCVLRHRCAYAARVAREDSG